MLSPSATMCLSRVISRALANATFTDSRRVQGYSTEIPAPKPFPALPRLLTAVSGIPKNSMATSQRAEGGNIGDDSYFVAKHSSGDVLGVADGVGGWRQYGIDPGIFSNSLMRACEKFVTEGQFSPSEPESLIANVYQELLRRERGAVKKGRKDVVIGSSTACVLSLNRATGRLHSANIGDSGFYLIRDGEILFRSREQTHYFNTPYQLALPPQDASGNVLCDSPETADTASMDVKAGDVILLCTDGLLDNMPEAMLLSEIRKLSSPEDAALETDGNNNIEAVEVGPLQLQQLANTLAFEARALSLDPRFLSPFAKAARSFGIRARGGKPDDITVLLATVCS